MPQEIMPTDMFNKYKRFLVGKHFLGSNQSEDAPHMPVSSSQSAMTRAI